MPISEKNLKLLQKEIEGDVLSARFWREIYSTDASIYKLVPELVVLPKNKEDVQKVVKFAKENGLGLPAGKAGITCRTAGTSLAGAALGRGVILDFSRYMNQIVEIGKDFVRVQPGIIYDKLNEELAKRGLFLPPSPASSRACMIGGNVATKASGSKAVKYGTMDNFVLGIEFVDAGGNLINTKEGLNKFQDKIEKLKSLKEKLRNDKEAMNVIDIKREIQNASSYNIFALLDYGDIGEMIAHLMVGSIGTLGVFTEIILKVVPKKKLNPVSWAVFLKNLDEIDDFIKGVKEMGCSGVELVDRMSLELACKNFPDLELSKEAEVMMIVEFDENIEESLKKFEEFLKKFSLVAEVIKEAEKMAKIWEVRKCLLPMTATFSKTTKPLVSIDDVGVKIKDIPSLLRDLREIFKDLKMQVAIYGHAGVGTIHIDPVIEATTKKDIPKIKEIADRVYEAVFKYGGTTATEHAGGRCRSMYLDQEWGRVYNYLKEIKEIFDPDDILNPGVMFNTEKKKITDDIKFPMKFLDETEWSCMDCAYCQSKCPAWIKSKRGETGPRQFKNLIRYLKLRVKPNDNEIPEIKKQIMTCILCGNCTRVCENIVGAKLKEFNERWRKQELNE